MKSLTFTLFMASALSLKAQVHQVKKLWETDTVLAIPESVWPDVKNNRLFVSLIDGAGWANDGKGQVGIVSDEGKMINSQWIKGLNAPKGMVSNKGLLYVADNSQVVVIGIKTQTIEATIPIKGATRLNDIEVDPVSQSLYVSDSKTGIIWKIDNNVAVAYLSDVQGANGLKVVDGKLYFAAGKSLKVADKNKRIDSIVTLPSGIDGIAAVGNGDLLVSAWAGSLYYVYQDGHYECLLDTTEEGKNAADISFDRASRIIYIPTFNGKTVAAYLLQ